MIFTPKNGYIQVKRLAQETKSSVALPEGMQVNTQPYEVVENMSGELLVVDTVAVEEIRFRNEVFYIVKENFIKGALHG